jgi:arginyl-tRNA synthetase
LPSSAPEILSEAVERVLGAPAILRPADPRFGDYQANGVIAVAKQRGQNPRALAETIIAKLDVADISEPPIVTGAGFISFRLKPAFVAQQLATAGMPKIAKPRTIVIDFSSPNVAKPMHVGHIRSTIIGDCLARVARFLGHRVITDNHIGDWGTQFGVLIAGMKQYPGRIENASDPIGELEHLYKEIYEWQKDPLIKTDLGYDAREEVAKLQKGDPDNLAIWRRIIELSQREFEKTYRRLSVRFDHTLGESFYNPMLPAVVNDLRERGIATVSNSAVCIFFEDHPDLKRAAPLIIQKADGAYLYGTTDLATFRYRMDQWHPDEIVYVTDARQKLHFEQLFAAIRKWCPAVPDLRHVYFGTILGEDGKPLKTREGTPVKLVQLLDEAEERALKIVTEKNPELPEGIRKQIARAVGIGAVKYADLSQNRTTDYVFSWSKMLAMTGNTAPYMQYAYVRVQSIFRKADVGRVTSRGAASGDAACNILLDHPAELDLAKHILRFAETLQSVLEDDKPNWLTGYLYDLTTKFSTFYENCPVIQSAEPTRSSRLALCQLTADVIKQGLNLLGIDVIEQM